MSFLVVWQWLSKVVNQSVIIPPPKDVIQSIIDILKLKFSYIVVFYTLKRVIGSFLISLSCAIITGFIAYTLPIFEKLLKPILYILKVVPVVAIILLILIWSNSEIAPSIVAFLMVFPLLHEGVINSLLSIDKKIIDMTKVYNVSIIYRFKDLYLPTIIFGITGIISSAFGLTFKSVVAGEVLSHPKFSVGGAIYNEKNYLNTSGVLAWLIIMVIINIILERIIKRLRGE